MFKILLLAISFSAQAVITFASEEYFRVMLPQYVQESDLIIVGNVYQRHINQYIEIKEVLKGNPQFIGKTLLTDAYMYSMGCGTSQLPRMRNDETAVAFFKFMPTDFKSLNNNQLTLYFTGYHLDESHLSDVIGLLRK